MIHLLFILCCVYVLRFDFLLGQCQQQILSIRRLLALTRTDVIDATLVCLDSYSARRQCVQSYSICTSDSASIYVMYLERNAE